MMMQPVQSIQCAVPQVMLPQMVQPAGLPVEIQQQVLQLQQMQQMQLQQQVMVLLQIAATAPGQLVAAAPAQQQGFTAPPPAPAGPPAPAKTAQAGGGRKKKGQQVKVNASDLSNAISSLYMDELKPYGRILRKRLSEMARAAGNANIQDVGAAELREACEARPWIHIEDVDGSDWAAVVVGQPQSFVDVYSPEDLYPAELWQQASCYFESLTETEMVLPGGRYSCAQVLAKRDLPWLAGRSLGAICHIVQLAISHKKLLGYLHGRVVPYGRSQSMIKDRHAESQKPCTEGGAAKQDCNDVADWDSLRRCVFHVLANMGPNETFIPLSNLKRLFRAQFHVELSETALGYAKLSELLQDPRLSDLCDIKVKGQGYVMAPSSNTPPRSIISLSESLSTATPDNQSDNISDSMSDTSGKDCITELPTNVLLRQRARFVQPLNMADIVSPTASQVGGLSFPDDDFSGLGLASPMPTPLGFPSTPFPETPSPTAMSMRGPLPMLLGAARMQPQMGKLGGRKM